MSDDAGVVTHRQGGGLNWRKAIAKMFAGLMQRTGEFYNNESKMLAAVSKFKKDPLTKQLLASASKTASQYCSSDMWSPCVTDDSEYDKAGIV